MVAPARQIGSVLRQPARWSRVVLEYLDLSDAHVRALYRICVLTFSSLLGLVVGAGTLSMPLRVYLATQSQTFTLVDWEIRHLSAHAGTLLSALSTAPVSSPTDRERIADYFALQPGQRSDLRWDAERAVERELSAAIHTLGIAPRVPAPVAGAFPPVAFRFVSPPAVLVVAPRDRLEVTQSVLLLPGLSTSDVDAIERRVDALGLSALVTPIGGLATYPAMVVEAGSPVDFLSTVAHEWVHAYLFFRPLGGVYWSSQEGRSLNETVAELVGRELGGALAERSGISTTPPTPEGSRADSRFRREMRVTRLEVERLLADGRIPEAEAYMEQRRMLLQDAGFSIRRLNQAYFAFHGSYAESGIGDNRIGALVRGLRAKSPTLAEFLERAGGVQSVNELQRLLETPG